jgi:hypothetical protein
MKKRSVVVGSLGGLVALVLGHGAALANAEWCVSDPPLQVVTPGGQNLMVNNMVYLALSSQGSQQGNFNTKGQTTETATVASNGPGHTLITVRIDVADGVQQARVVSSVNRFQVSSQGTGSAGSVIFLYLDVPIS